VNLLVLPAAIFVGVAAIRRHRGPLGDLVVELASASPRKIQSALARAVGDPSLELALWLPDKQQFVDETGGAVNVGQDGPERAVTLINSQDAPLAALLHDASLAGQRPLLEAAGSAARLALENARLHAELRGQLEELRASRARIVAAADTERRRVERDLHDGAQQRLLALGLALQLLADNQGDPQLLAEAQCELQAALHELRELARGIHPSVLTDRGLPAAVSSLVDRANIPISAAVADKRYPQPVESAAYFVVSEALANIAKHADANTATITVAPANGRLVIEVSDDGQGGAKPASGTGLQGLADRVGALDGQLAVRSSPGAGTTIRAEIPCAF
jgi:signal transduction histidine kinase